MQFFGEPWDAPICAYIAQAPTPVGELCLDCDKPIREGDQGLLIQFVPFVPADGAPYMAPHHRRCFIRSIWPDGFPWSKERQ
jgi:hypothetical protein